MNNKAAVCINRVHFELKYMKTHYPSIETFTTSYTSFVVPRGSPLQANNAARGLGHRVIQGSAERRLPGLVSLVTAPPYYTGARMYEQHRDRPKIELTRGLLNLHPCISQ